ncbi:hypothetical protein SAMN06265367_10544 [Algoriphagus winogradskyi]|uniref:Uncharacterized protein n=1 Tax=Algoriphagus winogradskyi TaxID=237017 RepID=A0ABY1P6F2_9BACT|nr:hypothetical protein SAMN06265367_10544 [Algoriphagus winogradskyi]
MSNFVESDARNSKNSTLTGGFYDNKETNFKFSALF